MSSNISGQQPSGIRARAQLAGQTHVNYALNASINRMPGYRPLFDFGNQGPSYIATQVEITDKPFMAGLKAFFGFEPNTREITTITGNPQGAFITGRAPTFGGQYYNNGYNMGGYGMGGYGSVTNDPHFGLLSPQRQQKALAAEQGKMQQEQQKLEDGKERLEYLLAGSINNKYSGFKVEIENGQIVAHKDGVGTFRGDAKDVYTIKQQIDAQLTELAKAEQAKKDENKPANGNEPTDPNEPSVA